MLKRSASLGTCFLAILLAPCEGRSQATSKSLDRLRAIDHGLKAPLVSHITSGPSHTVANGETLWGISRKYRVSFAELASLNALPAKNPVIQIGQKLRIPTAKKKAVTKKPVGPKEPTNYKSHQVGSGETFYRIARRHGVSVSALKKANTSTNPSALKVGATLRIPTFGKTAPKPPDIPPAPKPPVKTKAPEVKTTPPIKRSEAPKDRAHLAPKGFGIYTAQRGDTAASIAKQYGISREEFLHINKKSSYPTYAPRPGEFVMVPTDGSWYVPTHTQSQPTRKVNSLVTPPSNPLIGTRRTAPAQPRNKMLVLHEIRANDSLEALAKRFGTTTDQILLDNPGINGNRDLVVSKTLKIRTQSSL